MAWRITQQPNGLLARFSEIVDDFTHYNLTVENAVGICRLYDLCEHDAKAKVQRGIDAGSERYQGDIAVVRAIHGEETAQERDKVFSTPVTAEEDWESIDHK